MAEQTPDRGRVALAEDLKRIDGLIAAGEHTAATSACQESLQRHPTSATLHEKMGDTLSARQLWDDAAEWYDLARQLHATPELEEKIADARRRARQARQGGVEEEPRRASPVVLLVGLGLAAVLTVVLAVVLVSGWLRARSAEAPTSAEQIVGEFTPSAGNAAAAAGGMPRSVRGSPAAPGGGRATAPAAREIPGGHWGAVPPAERAPMRDPESTRIEALRDPVTDHDRLVINAVSSLTWGDDRPLTGRVDAMVDEFQGYAVIRVTVPPTASASSLSSQIVTMAYRVGLTAVRADEAISAVTVQMVRARSSEGGAVMEIIWRGNASRRNLEQFGGSAEDVEGLLTQVFAAVRWSSDLRPSPSPYGDGGQPGAGGAGAGP